MHSFDTDNRTITQIERWTDEGVPDSYGGRETIMDADISEDSCSDFHCGEKEMTSKVQGFVIGFKAGPPQRSSFDICSR